MAGHRYETDADAGPGLDERAVVLLALALDDRRPSGAHPSDQEIAAWHERGLSHDRGDEVFAHVARCESCYELWTALLDGQISDASHTSAKERDGWLAGLTEWFAPRRFALAGAAAASLAVALVVINMRPVSLSQRINETFASVEGSGLIGNVTETWAWSAGVGFRTLGVADVADPGLAEVAVSGFRRGVRDGLERSVEPSAYWRDVIAEMKGDLPGCGEVPRATCTAAHALMRDTGRWAVLLHFACTADADSALDEGFWGSQEQIARTLHAGITQTLPGSAFDRFYADWMAELDQSAAAPARALCARSASLLSLGLGG